MVYVSSIGPVDPETGQSSAAAIKEQTRQCLRNLKAKLEAAGSSLDKVVWANWSLRDPTEFDTFNEEWVALVPGRRADRPGDADAAAPAPGRVPGLDRGHRRGLMARYGAALAGACCTVTAVHIRPCGYTSTVKPPFASGMKGSPTVVAAPSLHGAVNVCRDPV